MTGSTASSTIEMLTAIWERVLDRSAISVDDNFFDLGGDPSSAKKLFVEILRIFHLELTPVTICYAPTIVRLAKIIERGEIMPLAPLVQLNSSSSGPPVFIAHGIGSSVLELVKLARQIDTRNPIYGLQLRGIDGVEEGFDRIEDAAQCFLDAIEKVQPNGPYFLIGYSLGGLITLEIAQRLSNQGKKIALLAMLDTYPHVRRLSLEQRGRLRLRLGYMRAISAYRWILRQCVPKIPDSEASILGRFPSSSADQARTNVTESSYVAWRNYNPRFYGGKIKFVRAEICTYFPDNPIPVWSHLANKIEDETIPGTHFEMLTTQSQRLASMLSHYLKETPNG
jgi:thioesterase domain-containing protein